MAYHFENIKLEKGMYGRSSRSFSQALEELDPSEHYRGTPLEGLDAFQRQLKRFDIHVKGAGSDMVEKFFHTSDSAVLFPEFVSRVVRQGMEEESILPAITATVTKFDGMDYRSIASVPSEEDKKLRRVEEGARIPETTVRTQENLVHLHKRGRMLVASYEAIRFQRLDLFSVTLRQIGAYIGRMHLEDAINVIVSGDGNSNPAASYAVGTSPISGESGTLSYDMSQYEIARTYFQWLCDHCRYDNAAADDSASHLAYGALVSGHAVCDGYTGAYNLLLKLEGIECTSLFNDSHIWTLATLDGTQYHIDVTWGDQYGRTDLRYFGMSEEQSYQCHPWGTADKKK